MRKRKTTIYDLGRLPVTEVKRDPNHVTSLREFTRIENERIAAEAEAKRKAAEAPILAAQKEFSKTLVALRKAQSENLFINPSEYLTENCTHLPERVSDSPEQVTKDIREAFDTLRLELSERGVTITPVGMEKIRKIVDLNSSIDIRQVENWRVLYSHLDDLGVFTDRDRTVIESKPVVQPVVEIQKSSLADIERIDTSTREGEAEAKRIVNELAEYELAPLVQEWEASLANNFGLYPTPEDRKRVTALFRQLNLSWGSRASYDRIRKIIWPEALTPEERVARDWERRTERSDTFEARRELANKLQQFGTKVLQ
jgi:hypothetical protein